MGPTAAPDAKPAKEVTTDFGGPSAPKPANEAGVTTDSDPANEAGEVTTDPGPPQSARSPSASACLPFHELIEAELAKGRNATGIWQDLVDRSSFTGAYESVKRYVRKLRGA